MEKLKNKSSVLYNLIENNDFIKEMFCKYTFWILSTNIPRKRQVYLRLSQAFTKDLFKEQEDLTNVPLSSDENVLSQKA